MKHSEVKEMKRDNRLSYTIGFVSFFYWLLVYIYPTTRLVSPGGYPLNGLGLLVDKFSDGLVSVTVMVVAFGYIMAIVLKNEVLRIIFAGLLFGIWVMSTVAMGWWAFTHSLASPTLSIYAGYCGAIYIDIRGVDNKWIGKK